MSQLEEVYRRLKRAVGVVYSLLVIIFITLTILATCLPVLIGYIWNTERPRRNSRSWRD
ncbi:MAG: hypothetical protein Q7S64_00225 [bacterium]|nr:hypothetical protein [bacterium]